MASESAEPRAGMSAVAGAVAAGVAHRTRPVVRFVFSPLLDVLLPMVVAEGIRRSDLATTIAKDVEAELAKVDLTALVLERVDLDAVVKTALATVDPQVLARQIADAQRADAARTDAQTLDPQAGARPAGGIQTGRSPGTTS